ncbi:hypothetical protein J1N35_022564, partial [Gossypium stocksii]
IQTQACQQAIEEAEKECKKILEKIDESHEVIEVFHYYCYVLQCLLFSRVP